MRKPKNTGDGAREREEAKETHRKPAALAEEPPKHSITIIGCIKTETGWYRLGFDEATKTLVPLEKV